MNMATHIGQTPLRMKGQTTCIDHRGKQLDLYCEKCDTLVCHKCLSTTHNGHALCELGEITPQRKQNITAYIDRTERNDLVQLREYINSTDTLLKDNTSHFESLSRKLILQTEQLKQDLDMLTSQTLSLYHKMKEDTAKLIQTYRQDLEMYDKQLKQQIQECKTALQRGSHIEVYDTGCEIYSQFNFPVQPVLITASFTPNTNPQHHLDLALGKFASICQYHASTDQDRSVRTSVGQGPGSTPQQSKPKGNKAVTLHKLLPQTKSVWKWRSLDLCSIGSICPTTDGKLWTSYIISDILTLLDRKGKVKQEVKHKALISDISMSRTTHALWVSDTENNILQLVPGLLLGPRLAHRFSTKEVPKCICVTASNHVIVGMAKHISKFTTQGQMVLTTVALGTGKPLVCTPRRISECPVTRNIAVADWNNKGDGGDEKCIVVVMDTDFKEQFVYGGEIPSTYKQTPQTGGQQFNPWGVVYDSVGNLIIGDYNNQRVLLLSGGGEFLSVIHTDTYRTLAVGVDREDVLWTAFSGRNIKVLQYSSA